MLREDRVTKTIPPTREKARRQLEKRADEILATAGEPTSEGWPQTWHPDREETEHDRIAVAHKGVHSLREAALFCMFPSYDPQEERGKISELMTQKPGADTEDVETVLATEGGFHKSGKEQPKREVWERCRWLGCGKSLYSPEKPRKRGNPRKYCDRHKRAAKRSGRGKRACAEPKTNRKRTIRKTTCRSKTTHEASGARMTAEPTRRAGSSVPARQAWWATHDPAVELQHLWGEVSRLFERAASETSSAPRHWMPLAEEEDAGDAYVVRAELPGVPRDRVAVELDGKELHITGSVEEGDGGSALNRRRGSFSYGIRVPGDVDSEGIRATLADGVLTVRLPKSGQPVRRRIDISVSRDA